MLLLLSQTCVVVVVTAGGGYVTTLLPLAVHWLSFLYVCSRRDISSLTRELCAEEEEEEGGKERDTSKFYRLHSQVGIIQSRDSL